MIKKLVGKEPSISMKSRNHLAIVHTTPVTVPTLKALCDRLLPGVECYAYLDESILPQINQEGHISPGVWYRFQSLVALAAAARPRVILCACSSVGGMLEAAREWCGIPLERIDQPMAQQAAARPGRIVACATVASTLEPTLDLLRRTAGPDRQVDSLLIEGAGALLAQGRQEEYLSLIASRLANAARAYDTVVLAQASMAQAVQGVDPALRGRFLTSPESGVAALQKYFSKE